MSLAFEINQRYFIKFPGGHPKNRPKIVIIIIFALILSLVIMPEALSITAKCAKCGAETGMNTYPDINVETAADYNYEAATFCLKNGHNAKAIEFAEKAKELSSNYTGKAYFLIGSIWGATTCSGDEISRRAPYWVAVDYMEKAKAADASLADDCNRMISQYRVYYPQTAEAFMYNLTDGQSYTVSCGGMKATTRVRTQK